MTQFDKLKAMRDAAAQPTVGVEQRATPDDIKAEQARMAAGEPAGGGDPDDDEQPPAPAPPSKEGEGGGEEKPEGDGDGGEKPEGVQVAAHTRKPPERTTAPPGTEAIELDGKTVYVAPELAAAFRDAEVAKVDAAKDAEANALVERVAAKVKESLPPQPAQKTEAELIAERALAAAETAPETHPMPDAKLQISDPDAFASQLAAHIAEKSDRAAHKALAEQRKKDTDAANAARATNEARAEEVAREQLGIQFYSKFKVLNDTAMKPLVDVLLTKKWDDVKERIKARPFKTAAEGEAFKTQCFNEVAADATRQIVAIRQQGTAAAPPPPEPPKVASSRAPTARATPAVPPEKPREKYPSGSMSAMLASHKAVKEGTKKGAAA